MADLEKAWGRLLISMMWDRGEAATELFRRLQEGAPNDLRDYLEEAYLDGRMSEEEWDFIAIREPQTGDLAKCALIVCEVFLRLGLFAPKAGGKVEA